jgi:hypothetical protein
MSYMGFGSISAIIHLTARLRFTSKMIVLGALLIVLCR